MRTIVVCLVLSSLIACHHKKSGGEPMKTTCRGLVGLTLDQLARKRARYADVDIGVSPDSVSKKDREVLPYLLRAADVMDRLFWRQSCDECASVAEEVAGIGGDAGRLLQEYVAINYGPYDRLDGDAPFYGSRRKPVGATFYPSDLKAAEFETWVKAHPTDKESFESPFTVIRREGDSLKAIPYSSEYRADLEAAAGHLRAAAEATDDPALARFLKSRADAFLSNDYFQSDCDWMDLGTATTGESSAIDVTIGPYEVYEDGLMNLKAAFEAFVTVRDEAETRKLSMVAGLLDELEGNLPLEDRDKNFSRGKLSPIAVVNVVVTAGDARKGVQTTAFNLPNDERVRAAKGSKKVMLKNVGEAKFNKSLIPICRTVLDPALIPLVTFDAYFNGILMHEVSHGLGPGFISLPDGTKTTVNLALKDTYSTIEECKADVVGVYNTLYLISKGTFPAELKARTEATFLGGIFRSVRFGVDEAHGQANIIEFNYLRRAGAFTWDATTGRFGVVTEKFGPAIKALARDLLAMEAAGDCAAARKFITDNASMPSEVTAVLARLQHVPVDIRPIYTFGD